MTSTTTNTSKWPIVVASVVAWTVLLYAIAVSSTHIIETAFRIGLTGWLAYTAPLLVDAVAIVGKLGRLERFSDETRRSSLWLFMFGGAISLTCNVTAGENLGQQIHGAIVVVVMVWLESHVTKMKLRRELEQHNPPSAPAAAPTSPGMPPVMAEPAEVLAYREAAAELRKTSRLSGLNAAE